MNKWGVYGSKMKPYTFDSVLCSEKTKPARISPWALKCSRDEKGPFLTDEGKLDRN